MPTGFDIELSGCSKRYGGHVVLDDVSLQVAGGDFVTVLGPSGCGKTTTLRAIGGFITVDEGEVYIRGRRVTELPPYLRNIGVVFQNYALWPHMTVFENLAFGLKIRRVAKDEIVKRVDRALGMVRLDGLKDRYPRALSGGQQQRVAMARALAIDPEVIILDEPLSNLDRRLREEMRIELKRLQRSLGVTMLFVTHDQEEALSMSNQVIVMQGGRIQQIADPQTLYQRPANTFVAGFLGNANYLHGVVRGIEADDLAIVDLKAGAQLRAQCSTRPEIGQEVRVMVRPEWLVVAREGDNLPTIRAQVREVIYEGASIRYGVAVENNGEELIFVHQLSNSTVFNIGDEITLNVSSANIVKES